MLSQQRKVLLGIRGRFPCHYCSGVSTTTTTTIKHNVNVVVPYIQQQQSRNTFVSSSSSMESIVYSLRQIQLAHHSTITRSMSTTVSGCKAVDSNDSDYSNKPVPRLRTNQKSLSANNNKDTHHTNTDSTSNITTNTTTITTKNNERSNNHRRKKQKRESLLSSESNPININTKSNEEIDTESNCIINHNNNNNNNNNNNKESSTTILHNNNSNNSLMIQCTKPSVIASLHPAVRSALLHDEIKHEFHNVHNSNIDTNIWH